MTSNITDVLASINGQNIALDLSERQLKAIAVDSPHVAERLRLLRDVVWNVNKTPTPTSPAGIEAEEKKRNDAFEVAIKGLSDTDKSLLIESYARMGNLYEISALTARDNYFTNIKAANQPIPGGVEGVVEKIEKAGKNVPIQDMVALLSKPVFEVVMTMHPTNVNSLESMQAQRRIAKALIEKDSVKLDEAISEYQKQPILHQDKGGKDANLEVVEETKTVLNALSNVYDDIPAVYARYDAVLEKKGSSEKGGPLYKPETLKLGAQFGSWGSSGDKDGNKKVTGETTLEAIAMHTQAILDKYAKELDPIAVPELSEWKDTIKTAQTQVAPLLAQITQLRQDSEKLRNRKKDEPALVTPQELSQRFDTLSQELVKVRAQLDAKNFETALLDSYKINKDAKILQLLRKERMFGFNFSKIEYRETAEEYSRVLGAFYDKQNEKDIAAGGVRYEDMTSEERVRALHGMFTDPVAALKTIQSTLIAGGEFKYKDAPDLYDDKYIKMFGGAENMEEPEKKAFYDHLNEIDKKAYHAAYSKDRFETALPIAFQSVQRLKLARDFPEMIKDNVLAECGALSDETVADLKKSTEKANANLLPDQRKEAVKAAVRSATLNQGVANLLEAKFLQHAVEQNGKKAVLGVVPLFEEPGTMMHVEDIMKAAYDDPIYSQHLKDVAAASGTSQTQQVQIAHSDNARRSGLPAARAFIHDAHDKIRALHMQDKYKHIGIQFFEGGSMSDPYRNGVRSVSGIIDDFKLFDYAKFTFQGGDLLTYFNDPRSTERLFTRNLAHQADKFMTARYAPPSLAERVARRSLTDTREEYEKQDFKTDTMGSLLAVLGYKEEAKNGGRGSRAASRTDAANSNKEEPVIVPVDIIHGVRTISFSEAMQHNGLVPTWIGAQKLEVHMRENIFKACRDLENKDAALTTEESNFYNLFRYVKLDELDHGKIISHPLSGRQINYFYGHENPKDKTSPLRAPSFRDAQDRAAFGHALTDMDKLSKIVHKNLAEKRELIKVRAEKLDAEINVFEKSGADVPQDLLKRRSSLLKQSETLTNAEVYLDALKDDYRATALVSYSAFTAEQRLPAQSGEENVRFGTTGIVDSIKNVWRKMMRNALPHLESDIEAKRGYRDLLLNIKTKGTDYITPQKYLNLTSEQKDALTKEQKAEIAAYADHLGGLLHAGGDTVMHGRWLMADDQAFSRAVQEEKSKAIAK